MDHDHELGEAPPSTPGDFELVEAPERWPSVIGTLGIVFSALGLLGGLCGVLGSFSTSFFVNMVPAEQRAQMQTQMQYGVPYPLAQGGIQILEFLLTIVLLVGSIQLVRRRRSGGKTLVTYAWLDLVMNFIGTAVYMLVVQAQAEMLKANPDLLKSSGSLSPSANMALYIGLFLLSCIWPAFLIIWFGREKVRSAMDRWDDRMLEEGAI